MNKENTRILKGDICYSIDKDHLVTMPNSYLICENGSSAGVSPCLPTQYRDLPIEDYTGKLIVPGLIDLHVHAPQYAFRGLKMDLELLDWLDSSAFPEEARYADQDYARKAYSIFVQDLKKAPILDPACLLPSIFQPPGSSWIFWKIPDWRPSWGK